MIPRTAAGAINPSKLYQPRRRPTLVRRPRLVERIDAGVWRPLTVVVAPAGSGKTTLVSQWMAETDRPVAWLSLDEADNDPLRFLAYLLAAIRRIVPEVGEGLDGVAPTAGPSDLTGLLTETLLVPLSLHDDPLALVLDDYHAIDARVVHDALSWLVDHLPPSMHLVITTREEPPLSLPLRRVRDEVTEVRRSDLEFDGPEATAFLSGAFALDLDPATVEEVRARTEGWAAGLQLAGLSLSQGTDVAQVLDALGRRGDVADYLVEEVLDQLEPGHRAFLLHSAVLDELDGEVCAHVTGADDAVALLRDLDRRGLFLVALDHQRHKYRFHHLFGELLRARLDVVYPGRGRELHRRAAAWHLDRGDAHRAAAHARAADDLDLLADVVDRWGLHLVSRSDRRPVEAWLEALPDHAADRWPGVGLLTGWMAVLPLRVPPRVDVALEGVRRARAVLDRHDGPAPPHWSAFPAHLRAIEALATRPFGDPVAGLAHARAALDDPTMDDPTPRSVLELQIGVTHWMGGWPTRALAPLERAARLGQEGGNHFAALAAMGYRAACLAACGRLRDGEAACVEALAYAERQGCAVLGVTAYVYGRLARIRLERWELPGALEAFEQGLIRARLMGDPFVLVDTLVSQARAREDSGESGLADEALAEASAIAARSGLPLLEGWARLGYRVVDVLRGAPEPSPLPDPAAYRGATHDAALFAVRGADAGADAGAVIEAHRVAAASAQRRLHVLDWEVEAIVATGRGGDAAAATALLEGVVRGCAEEGIRRVFAERAAALAPLVPGLSTQARGVLGGVVTPPSRAPAVADSPARPAPDLPPLREVPSRREREVLALVAEGLSNPEIARALFVSTGTVKTHVHRLLDKLGARNRVEAVRTAAAHGLIP